VLVDPTGRRHVGADAIRYLSLRFPQFWLLAPLLYLPGSMPIWQWCYQQIARRRYRWNQPSDCENGSCSLHFGRPASTGEGAPK
jgi:predicted DCC family thiol-disulfide oxidoreductase YuxK